MVLISAAVCDNIFSDMTIPTKNIGEDDNTQDWTARTESPEPVVIVAIWRINRGVVHGQIAVSGEAAPMLHVLSS